MMIRHLALFLSCLVVWLTGCAANDSFSNVEQARPNILFVVVDDMGYADLGAFGSEIPTPNIDALAYGGIRLTNFRTAPACSPSRAMLLTGADAHLAGLGNMLEEIAPNQEGRAGYEGRLSDRVVTIAELLSGQGYRTYLSGKWHLGSTPESLPSARGFDQTFVLASGGASHFADMRPAYAPTPDVKASYFENGQRLATLPASFEYSSQYYVDWLVEALGAQIGTSGSADDGQTAPSPFFAMLSFTAPHWPLQAPDAALARFKGRYDEGYDAIRQSRFAQQKSLGVVPKNAVVNNLPGQPWHALSVRQRKESARAMETYAAMIHEIDNHTGRLIAYLRQANLLDNTIVVFLSDNGAEGHTLDETWPKEMFPKIRATIDAVHNFSYDNIGRPDSYTFYNAQWARASSPTTRWHKGFVSEGGLKSSAFVYYPAMLKARIEAAPVFIKDLMPTVLDLAGLPRVTRQHPSVSGRSIRPVLLDSEFTMPRQVEVLELFGKIAVVDFPFKAIRMPAPWQERPEEWALYNLLEDNLETNDISSTNPKKLNELKAAWRDYQDRYDVILPDWVSGY